MDTTTENIFGRINENETVSIFHSTGEVVTALDANVYPVDSDLGARYEHPNGIVLTAQDAEKLNITINR